MILAGYALGEPFELGADGSFVATQTGKLYLRCRDDWNRITDNQGAVEVRLQLSRESAKAN